MHALTKKKPHLVLPHPNMDHAGGTQWLFFMPSVMGPGSTNL